MTAEEFSNEYDTLLTSYLRFKKFDDKENLDSIEVNEYEKSVYLTKAQENILIGLYTGRNPYNNSYEQTEELRRYLANLNRIEFLSSFTAIPDTGLSLFSVSANIQGNVLFITQEQCLLQSEDPCVNDTWVDCIPVKRDEYNVIKNNPFKNNKVFRIDKGVKEIELISKHSIGAYKVSYIIKPVPIVLEDISPLSIEGVSVVSQCELHEALHKSILERAVQESLNDILSKYSEKEK